MERAGDAGALEGLARGVFLADGHEAGHLGLGDGDLAAAPWGERDVGDAVILDGGGLGSNGSRGHVQSLQNDERAPLHGGKIQPIEPGRNAHAYRRSAPRWNGVGSSTSGKLPSSNRLVKTISDTRTSRPPTRRRLTGSGDRPKRHSRMNFGAGIIGRSGMADRSEQGLGQAAVVESRRGGSGRSIPPSLGQELADNSAFVQAEPYLSWSRVGIDRVALQVGQTWSGVRRMPGTARGPYPWQLGHARE